MDLRNSIPRTIIVSSDQRCYDRQRQILSGLYGDTFVGNEAYSQVDWKHLLAL
ncbi:MAG: hypothetical protein OXE59_12365 [Bacteroidetes bacterium]|nr:hypothetical protein [Bacteroidota bacterium]